MPWEEAMERARRLHRPSLKDWQRDGMYHRFPAYVRQLEAADWKDDVCVLSSSSTTTTATTAVAAQQHLPVRLDARETDVDTFTRRYEGTATPCVIANVPAVERWPAVRRWTLDAMSRDETMRSRVLKCGEDDDGRGVRVRLRHFCSYMQHNRDDSPLYIFDTASFDEDDEDGDGDDDEENGRRRRRSLARDYTVPSYFRDDLFRYVSEARRPPYRWFLVGPRRSGTTVHVDPLGTSAWNTLIVGKKRWVLFPPHVPKAVVKGRGLIYRGEDDEAIHYFTTILPRIRQRARQAAAAKTTDDAMTPYRDFACYEFTQHAGETVFVPTGWWHAVLNLTHTVGCTQNFCSPRNFDAVWCQTRRGRKKMAWKWLRRLRRREPELYRRARHLNARDGFVMKYDPQRNSAATTTASPSSRPEDDERKRKKSSSV